MQADTPLLRSDKTPPLALEEESAICSCLLLNSDAIMLVADKLAPDDFYSGQYRTIYSACLHLYSQQKPCDLMSVARWLTDHKQIDQAGGMKGLSGLLDRFELTHYAPVYAGVIREKHQRRQAVAAAHRAIQLAHDEADWKAAREQMQKDFFSLSEAASQAEIKSFAQLRDLTTQNLSERGVNGKKPGIASGFYDLDAMTQGFRPGDLIVVAGRPSMGKTAIAINMARHACQSLPVMLFSLEMSAEQLFERMLSSEAEALGSALQAGRVNDWDTVGRGLLKLGELPGYIDDSAGITVETIRTRTRQVKARHGELGMVLIDYLQLMGTAGRNRVQELGEITRSLKGLARELGCPVMALSQLSRAVEERTGDKRPKMSDLRESGCIEQDADLILMMYREEYYNPDTPDRGIAEVIVAKHRNGPTGTVKLLFEPHYTRFLNLKKSI